MTADAKPNNMVRQILTVHCPNRNFDKLPWSLNSKDTFIQFIEWHHICATYAERGMIAHVYYS